MDGAQTCRLPPGQAAQGRSEEEASEGSCHLHYLCFCRCNGSEPSICHPHGLYCRSGQMMVRASMGVDIHNVSIHGWANNAYRTPSCSPLYVHHAPPALIPVLSRSPGRSQTPEGNIQRLHPRESMAVAAQREKNSFYPQAPPQEEETVRAFADRIDHQNNTQDLLVPIPVSVLRVGCQVEGWLREILASHQLRELPSIS
jgi:hypothetical protein